MNFLRAWNIPFSRFLVVGVLNTIVGLSVMLILFNAVELGYWLSTCLGNGVGAIVSYVLNRSFTFRSRSRVKHTWWKFVIVVSFCYLISYRLCLWVFTSSSTFFPGIPDDIWGNGAILAGSGLYTLTSYLGHKYYTFK